MLPEDVGISQSKLVLGKHSGRHAFKMRLQDLGYEIDDADMNRAFDKFKALADAKKYIFDEDIETLVSEEISKTPEVYTLEGMCVTSGIGITPSATVKMSADGRLIEKTMHGDGPVDAVYKAIIEITGTKSNLLKFDIKGITDGTDALGEVVVQIEEQDKTARGQGSDTDIIVAAARAYINALNKLAMRKNQASH
jgi:2-isopropylmalate synthase